MKQEPSSVTAGESPAFMAGEDVNQGNGRPPSDLAVSPLMEE
jgi:hypothetical protein